MENEALKQAFRNLHAKITRNVTPDSVIDELVSKRIISDKDYCDLRQSQDATNRCRDLFALLYSSSHPETFIQLREALLLDEYREIVDEIDKQLTELTAQHHHHHHHHHQQQHQQQQRRHLSQSTGGKFLSAACSCVCVETQTMRDFNFR